MLVVGGHLYDSKLTVKQEMNDVMEVRVAAVPTKAHW